MKKLFFLILLIVTVLVNIDIIGFTQWLKGTTYIYGHDVTGSLPTWLALICLSGPLLIVGSVVAVMYVKYKLKTEKSF